MWIPGPYRFLSNVQLWRLCWDQRKAKYSVCLLTGGHRDDNRDSRRYISQGSWRNICTEYRHLISPSTGLEKIHTRLTAASPKRRRDYAPSYSCFALWFVFVCSFCVFFDRLVCFLPHAVSYDSDGSQDRAFEGSNWSFGQIVAITVWAGPFFEYLHLSFRK